MKKLILAISSIALSVASAATTYRVTFFQPSVVAGTELKAGDYRVEVNDSKAVITQGKTKVEADVKVETADSKFGSTSVRYTSGEGKYKVSEIRIGGTNTKLVFNN